MGIQKTLGGDRLGSGKKMKVSMHGYERSTHDLGYVWRSTMSAGTLVPFLKEVALPGDTFDINLALHLLTHPTVGPLFGSYKAQLDIFQCPIRLYQGQLHNNKLGIGMQMANVKLPTMTLTANPITAAHTTGTNIDNLQINPSCLLSYLGIRGVVGCNIPVTRDFNAVPLLAYWDIYKQYYSNKMEEVGAVIHRGKVTPTQNITLIRVQLDGTWTNVPRNPPGPDLTTPIKISIFNGLLELNTSGTAPEPQFILLKTSKGTFTADQIYQGRSGGGTQVFLSNPLPSVVGTDTFLLSWDYLTSDQIPPNESPTVNFFPLDNIDKMREAILGAAGSGATAFNVNAQNLTPYEWLIEADGTYHSKLSTQEGLAIKTYQSDLFNNWLSTEWIDGPNGISEITSIDTSGGSFTIDTLNLSKKVYDMLNRIAVSGGTYDDWLDVNYDHDRYTRCESPMYMGGLIKELVFQEVISQAEAAGPEGSQPLGTLAGRGTLGQKHKGGQITIKVDEPSYIIGLISLTPRLDYSQGNKWDTGLQTMDDLHKPALDEIGFQELITEQMAWWTSNKLDAVSPVTKQSAGKQPAWINYMTNVNEVRGNFAIEDNQMFMTLNRKYEYEAGPTIKDLTTYIDPVKFNHIFAQTSLDAQNFWAQIGVDMQVRRKISAKLMPNL